MRKFLLLLLLFPALCFGDSESTIGGRTGTDHIIQDEGTSLRPRPYLNFTGSGVSCADTGGKTVCTMNGGGGGGGSIIRVDSGDTLVVASIDTLDFNSGFNVTESPSGEANITLKDAVADGSTKGVAAFNATNFSASSGVVNTIQGISSSATPSFAGMSLTGGLAMSYSSTSSSIGTYPTIGASNTSLATSSLSEVYAQAGNGARKIRMFVNGLTNGVQLGTTTAGTPFDLVASGTSVATVASTGFTVAEGKNFTSGTTTGTKIGTDPTEKWSFFNATPIVQPGATTDLGVVLSNLGLRATGTAYPITTSGSKTFGDLSASQAVFTDGSKILVSNAITGSGNVVMSASPTLTGSPLAPTQTVNDNSTKIATTAYVDNAVIGQNYKEAVKVATTATLVGTYSNGASGVGATFTYTATGVDAVDGVNLALGDRVLLKNQASDLQNGIYTVTTAGAIGVLGILTRATDANQSFEYKTGDLVFVTAGTTLTSTTWAYTGIDSPTMGTTSLTYVQVAGQGSFTGGNGITITGTSVAINTAVTADLTTAQTLSAKTLSYAVASGAGTYKGNILTLTSTETQAIGDAVQIDSSGQAHLAKADTLAHASGVLLAAAAVSGSASNTYLLPGGTLKLSSSPSWTVGGLVYLSSTGTTGNTLTQTAPSSTDNAIQILGVAVAADTILFMPSLSQITHT